MAETVTAAGSCTRFTGGRVCATSPASAFMNGTLCAEHAPPRPVVDPTRTAAALIAQRQASNDAAKLARFYGDDTGHSTVSCPHCGFPADALIGHHGVGDGGEATCGRRLAPTGAIRVDLDTGHRTLAEMIVRETAASHAVFSANMTRDRMDDRHIPVAVRTKVYRELVGVVMKPIGYEPSTEQTGRGRTVRAVRTYQSLIYRQPKGSTP